MTDIRELEKHSSLRGGCSRIVSRMKSRRGSASALIVLMVVLLAVFGAMALTSAAANLRLAARHADWSREYYGYDATAERLVALLEDRKSVV